ncbi:MAG: hypothetical protein K2L46_01280, partial [Paramuribaculum sp.]|nr:hypothetical protein [Paramuribaculum sp.]
TGLYSLIGTKLKQVFVGYHAWIIGYREEYFQKIGLAPSLKEPLYNGALECELREYVIFQGDYRSFRRDGGRLKTESEERPAKTSRPRSSDREWRSEARKAGFGGKRISERKPFERERSGFSKGEEKYRPQKGRFAPRVETPKSENPLAARRNEHALKSIIGREPSISKEKSGVTFRPRRGWKRPGQDDAGKNETND